MIDIQIFKPEYGNIETLFKVEPPFTMIGEGFHGYIGVVLYDKEKDKIQCHICGNWYSSMSQHVFKTHKIPLTQYKKIFQLPIRYPLVSRKISRRLRQVALDNDHLGNLRNTWKRTAHEKRSHKSYQTSYRRSNASFHNKLGLCSEQINHRYMIVLDIIGKEPSYRELQKYDPSCLAALTRRYGTLNNFRKIHSYKMIEKAPSYSEEQMIAFIRKMAIDNKRVPVSRDFSSTRPQIRTIVKKFGSWNRALAKSGF